MIIIYKSSNTSCPWNFMENHFTLHHLESIQFFLSEILFYFLKPCLESICSFFRAHLSDYQVSFCSANGHPFIPSFIFLL